MKKVGQGHSGQESSSYLQTWKKGTSSSNSVDLVVESVCCGEEGSEMRLERSLGPKQ